ncbi:MAG: type II toxin-antitoxin system Phd/YefM family antitoxin [Planctomycetes bacterium]|nr:type II toxin-antitoxin system Phd/YefM family antitoxin [Planctomycetota bacterium]
MYLNVSEAKTRFSELVDQVANSEEEITVGLRNVPKVKIVPIGKLAERTGKRELGKFSTDVLEMSDSFNDLPDEWEGLH